MYFFVFVTEHLSRKTYTDDKGLCVLFSEVSHIVVVFLI